MKKYRLYHEKQDARSNIGCSWVGLIIFKFVCSVTEKTYCTKKSTRLIFSIIPVLTIALAMTNEFHGLVWQKAHVESNSLIQALLFQRRQAFWVFVTFSYGLILWVTLLLIKDLALSTGLYRKQLTIILSGIMVPWFCNALYLVGFQGIMNMDLTLLPLKRSWTVWGTPCHCSGHE